VIPILGHTWICLSGIGAERVSGYVSYGLDNDRTMYR